MRKISKKEYRATRISCLLAFVLLYGFLNQPLGLALLVAIAMNIEMNQRDSLLEKDEDENA